MFECEVLKSLNELEMSIYNYIIEHKDEIKYMTIRELAEATHVSTSTILRFCKKIKCEGYSEFKIKFKMYLKQEKQDYIANDIEEIMCFFHSVTSEVYKEAIDTITNVIRQSRQLIFIGIGTSGVLGKYGARYFSNLNKYSQYIEDPYYPIRDDMENTVVIALSVSGETKETITLAEALKKHRCTLVSITNRASSTLSKMSDYNLSYHVSEKLISNVFNVTTQVPVIYLLESIGRRL